MKNGKIMKRLLAAVVSLLMAFCCMAQMMPVVEVEAEGVTEETDENNVPENLMTGGDTEIKEDTISSEEDNSTISTDQVNNEDLQGTAFSVFLTEDCGEYKADSLILSRTEMDVPDFNEITTIKDIDGNEFTGYIKRIDEESSSYTTILQRDVKSVSVINTIRPHNIKKWFYQMNHCTSFDLSKLDTTNVTNMDWLFYGCESVTDLDLSNFDTSNVMSTDSMFFGCRKLERLNISSFDTSKMTNMSGMFCGCYSLADLDVSGFNTSKVTDMSYMFSDISAKNLDLSKFDTSNVKSMRGMFLGCNLPNLDLSTFNTSNVVDMSYMFESFTSQGLDMTSFDTSKVACMAGMFAGCYLKSLDLSCLNTSSLIKIKDQNSLGMFEGCKELENLNLSNFNTSQVTDMARMFSGCNNLTSLNLSSFDTRNVTDMSLMFEDCNKLTEIDLSSFDTSKVNSMWRMFKMCCNLKELDLSGFNTSHVKNMNQMFWFCDNLTSLNISNFDTSQITSMGGTTDSMDSMFYYCSRLKSLDLSSFDTSNVTDMSYMFYGCNSLTSLNLSSFDTSKVTNMSQMFYECNSLTDIDLSNFDTSNLASADGMFGCCSSLRKINLSHFDTSKMTGLGYMFQNCSSLTSLDVRNFDTSNVTDMSYMFYGCNSLTSLNLSNFDTSSVTNMSFMFNGCSSLIDLDLSNFDTSNVIGMRSMFNGCLSLKVLDLSSFDISKVNDMQDIFKGTSSEAESKPGRGYAGGQEIAEKFNKYVDQKNLSFVYDPNHDLEGNIPEDAVEFNDHKYYVYNKEGEQFDFASMEKFCEDKGGHLLTINSKEEDEFAYNLSKQYGKCHFGLVYDEYLNSRWATGENPSYQNWASGHPVQSSHYWAAAYSDDGSWTDGSYFDNAPFICEWGSSQINIKTENASVKDKGSSVSSQTIEHGSSLQLKADVYEDSGESTKVVWSSSDPSVATVDKNGLVVGVADGMAIIKAVSEDNYLVAYCKVIVKGNYYGIVADKEEEKAKNVSVVNGASAEFNHAVDNYISTIRKVALPVDIEKLAKDMEKADGNSSTPCVVFPKSVSGRYLPDKGKDAVYYALAKYVVKRIDSVELSDLNYYLDAEKFKTLCAQIWSGTSGTGKFSLDHDGYQVELKMVNAAEDYVGTVTVNDTETGETYNGTIVSDNEDEILGEYRSQMEDLSKDAGDFAIWSSLTGMLDYTDISKFTEEEITNKFSDLTRKALQKKGLGDVEKTLINICRYINAVKKLSKVAKADDLSSIMDTPNKMVDFCEEVENIDFSTSVISNFLTRQAVRKLKQAAAAMYEEVYNAVYNRSVSKVTPVKNTKKIKINCPVDAAVYDESGSLVGYFDTVNAHDDDMYSAGDVKLELNGDEKIIYIPDGSNCSVKLLATDDGYMSYTIEHFNSEGSIDGRYNFNNVPLEKGKSYTQIIPAQLLCNDSDINTFPLVSAEDGTKVYADAYASASDIEYYTIKTQSNSDHGAAFGDSKIVKGDRTTVYVTNDDGYRFDGWFDETGTLVAKERVYSFVPTSDLTLTAQFTEIIDVDKITLNTSKTTLQIDDTEQLTAFIEPSNATEKTVVWSSSDSDVAEIDHNGLIHAKKAGTAVITAAAGNQTATCTVTVEEKTPEKVIPTSATLNNTSLSLDKGGTAKLEVKSVSPEGASTDGLTWQSSDETVATVDTEGNVTAVGAGTATIRLLNENNEEIATCTVTVNEKVPEKMTPTSAILNKNSLKLGKDGSEILTVDALEPQNASTEGLKWSSSNEKAATVNSDGKVKAVGNGSTTISLVNSDGTVIATCTVTVTGYESSGGSSGGGSSSSGGGSSAGGKAADKTVTMYRVYNPNSGEHLYTADAEEKDHLVSLGWNDEGVGWTAPSSGDPVYRLYNSNAGEHHYTMDKDERDMLVSAGWKYESVGWYSDSKKSVPVYRQYNPNEHANNHNYTTSTAERDHLLSLGWKDENVGWYAVK